MRNQTFQNLKNSSCIFAEHEGDFDKNFLNCINPKFIELYNHYRDNTELSFSLTSELVTEYLEFLEMHSYPEEEIILCCFKSPYPHKYKFQSQNYSVENLKILCQYPCVNLLPKFKIINDDLLKICVQYGQVENFKFIWTRVKSNVKYLIHNAIQYNQLEMLKHLMTLQSGYEKEIFDLAFDCGLVSIIKYLLEIGHRPNRIPYSRHWTPELLDLLYQYQLRRTMLHLRGAANWGHEENFNRLILEIPLPDDDSIIRAAICGGNWNIFTRVIESQRIIFPINILHMAVNKNHYEMTKVLLQRGARVREWDLEAVCQKYQPEMIKLLIDHGGNIHTNNDMCLRVCAEHGNLEMVQYLLEKGADLKASNHYALRKSAENNHLEIVKYLIEKGSDIHADQDYALRHSAVKGHLRVVKYLIEKGANLHVNNDYIFRKGTPEVIAYLQQL